VFIDVPKSTVRTTVNHSEVIGGSGARAYDLREVGTLCIQYVTAEWEPGQWEPS